MSVYENLTETQAFACRVIADHARTTAFAIADGILPGNEGRNYVLRKIMRRAIYHGREHLGLKDLFFHKVCDLVVSEMRGAYPELETQREFIGKMVRLEEEKFAATMTVGLERFNFVIPNLEKALIPFAEKLASIDIPAINKAIADKFAPLAVELLDLQRLARPKIEAMLKAHLELTTRIRPAFENFSKLVKSKEFEKGLEDFLRVSHLINELNDASTRNIERTFIELAKLYDTYGTPRDLIRIALEEQGVEISEEEFNSRFDKALQELQQQGDVGKTERKSQLKPIYAFIMDHVFYFKQGKKSIFVGYEKTSVDEAKLIYLMKDDLEVREIKEGEQGQVVLDTTPFYAEAGGQVGDTGWIEQDGSVARVTDTYSPLDGLVIHKIIVDKGSIKFGNLEPTTSTPLISARVDVEKRDATRRNHTATHLVHAALREVLGTHIKQAGSVVAPNYLRFDYTHYQPITAAEMAEIENLVNRYILQNEPVSTNVMAIEEAMRGGAMALFGEKYGADVRVLSVGDGIFSKELCGGTHVRATGDIGSFKITSDEAIASGVRRIRAITGLDAFERFREDERLIDRSLGVLKTQRDQLPAAIEKLQEELKKTRKEMDDLKLKIATGSIGGGSADGDEPHDVAGVKVMARIVEDLDSNGVRQLSDTLLARLKSGVVVIGRNSEGKVGIIVRVSDDLTDRVKAGNIIKEIAPIIGGRGGGKADMAEGGGNLPEKLQEAIEASYGVISTMVNS